VKALHKIYFAVLLCGILESGWAQPLQEASRKSKLESLDDSYSVIYGSPRGRSFILHYCLPDFAPRKLGGCGSLYFDNDHRAVNVEYFYALDGELDMARKYLEAAPAFSVSINRNQDISGKTPYEDIYRLMEGDSGGRIFSLLDDGGEGISGLSRYTDTESTAEIWTPTNFIGRPSLLGNPPIFICVTYCYFSKDLGDGWLARAQFDRAALGDWMLLVSGFEKSINVIEGAK
jgi:hypothetical protein